MFTRKMVCFLKIFNFIAITILFIVLICSPKIIFAATGQVTVSAFVDSDASASLSTLEVSSPEVAADGKSFCTITVTVVDKDGNPLADKKVVLRSNRGLIDTLSASSTYAGTGQDAGTADYSAESYTNVQGKAYFKIQSEVAGKTTVTAFVDNAVTLSDSVVIVFKKPPSAIPVTITTTIPAMFGMPERTITLFQSGTAKATEHLVDTGSVLQISFPLFAIGGLVAIVQPLLIIVLIVQSVAYRRKNEKMLAIVEEIKEHEDHLP